MECPKALKDESTPRLEKCPGTPRLEKMSWYPQIGKMSWYPQIGKNVLVYPHSNKLLQKCVIFNKTINLHSRGPTEQHFYIWEPHCGCCLWTKKVQFHTPLVGGQQSHKYAF